MVEVVGSIPIAPTTSRGRTLLFAPGTIRPFPLPRLALGTARREGRFRALDAKVLRAPPRPLGLPGHQSAPAGPEAARPMAGFRRNPSNMLYLAHVGWLPAPMPWPDRADTHRESPICFDLSGRLSSLRRREKEGGRVKSGAWRGTTEFLPKGGGL